MAEFEDMMRAVFGEDQSNWPERTASVTFRQIIRDGIIYFRAEDVADMLDSLDQHRTARHIREHCYPSAHE